MKTKTDLRRGILKTIRSQEFNKPKAKNLKRDENGNIIDLRTPRDEDLIKKCHQDINLL